MTQRNSKNIAAVCTHRIAALGKHLSSKGSASINGEPYKLAELLAIYQACLDSQAACAMKRAELSAMLKERDGNVVAFETVDEGLKAWVATTFGLGSQTAGEFGFLPRKAGEKSIETKMRAVEQLRATRKARNTMGKKQRREVKGTLPVAATAVPLSGVQDSLNGGGTH